MAKTEQARRGLTPEQQAAAKRLLTPGEREGLKTELAQKEAMLKADEQFGEGEYRPAVPREVMLNRDKIRADADRLRRVLDDGSPEPLTDVERRKVEKEMEDLEHQFMPFLETWQDLRAFNRDTPEYQAALKKAKEQQKVEHLIVRWKELAKRLEPDNPDFCKLARLRKAR